MSRQVGESAENQGGGGGANSVFFVSSIAIPFLSPFVLRPLKLHKFLCESYNHIKYEIDPVTENMTTGERLEILRQELEEAGEEARSSLWGTSHNWKQVLGRNFYDLFIKGEGKWKEGWKSSVVNLLRVYRNKDAHPDPGYTLEEKLQSDWFLDVTASDGSTHTEFDRHRFVQCFIEKFCNLGPFLWDFYQTEKHSLKFRDLYPSAITNSQDKLELDFGLSEFVSKLWDYNTELRETGQMEARYTVGSGSSCLSLEFTGFPEDLLLQVLDGSRVISIEIFKDSVKLNWYGPMKESLVYKLPDINIKKREGWGDDKLGVFIIANNVTGTEQQIILERCQSADAGCKKIVVYSALKSISGKNETLALSNEIARLRGVTAKYNPLQWEELKTQTKRNLLEFGSVIFQGNTKRLAEILPREESPCCHILQGDFLNELLKGEVPNLLQKSVLVPHHSFHLDRVITQRVEVKAEVLSKAPEKDIFIIENINADTLHDVLSWDKDNIDVLEINGDDIFELSKDLTVLNISSVSEDEHAENVSSERLVSSGFRDRRRHSSSSSASSSGQFDDEEKGQFIKIIQNCNSKFYLVQFDIADNEKFLSILFRHFNATIHLLRYVHENIFQWVATKGPLNFLHQNIPEFSEKSEKYNEVPFLQRTKKRHAKQRIMFFADKAGMGKTETLLSCAHGLQKDKHVVVLTTVKTFLQLIGNDIDLNCIPKESLKSAICSLACSNEHEMVILSHLIDNTGMKSGQIFFELMLDGLDELVESKLVGKAIQVLKALQESLPLVRVWVTLRDHMLNIIQKEFDTLGYCIEAFSESDQVEYLETFWLKEIPNEKKANLNQRKIKKFAQQCVHLPLPTADRLIAGTPLICRMIGEIYQGYVLEGNFDIPATNYLSLVDIYKQVIDKKFDEFLRRQQLSPDPSINDMISCYHNKVKRSHVYLVVKLLFSEKVANELKPVLDISSDSSGLRHIENVGIVEKLTPLTFFHRTVAEFIVAQFMFEEFIKSVDVSAKNTATLNVSRIKEATREFFLKKMLLVSSTYSLHLDFDPETTMLDMFQYDFAHSTVCYFFNALIKDKARLMSPDIQFSTFSNFRSIPWKFQVDENPHLLEVTGKNEHFNINLCLLHFPEFVVPIFTQAVSIRDYKTVNALSKKNFGYMSRHWDVIEKFDIKNKYNLVHLVVVSLFPNFHVIFNLGNAMIETETMDFLKYLVKVRPSLLEQTDTQGRTPFMLLSRYITDCDYGLHLRRDLILCYVDFFLVELGANVYKIDNDGNNVLHIPNTCSGLKNDSLLIKSFADVYPKFLDLVMKSVDPNATDIVNSFNQECLTPLFSAIKYLGNDAILVLPAFKKYGVDYNTKNGDGETPLYYAIKQGLRFNMIKILVECGADAYLQNDNGQSAVDLAMELQFDWVVEYLVQSKIKNTSGTSFARLDRRFL